ncbi:hypothetical protein QQ045_026913 [Rhodiola kirilowii]
MGLVRLVSTRSLGYEDLNQRRRPSENPSKKTFTEKNEERKKGLAVCELRRLSTLLSRPCFVAQSSPAPPLPPAQSSPGQFSPAQSSSSCSPAQAGPAQSYPASPFRPLLNSGMASTRKHELGSSKRKRIKERDKFSESQSGAMDKFVFKKGKEPQCPGDIEADVDVDVDVSVDAGVEENVEQPMEKPFEEDVDVGLEENVKHPIKEPFEEDVDVNVEETMELGLEGNDDIPNIFDPKNWDNLAPKWRDLLVKEGPLRDVLTGKVFKTKRQQTQLAHDGIRDWGHLYHSLKQHERSSDHITHYLIWVELRVRLKTNQVIDKVLQDQIKLETEHWRKIRSIRSPTLIRSVRLRTSASDNSELRFVPLIRLSDSNNSELRHPTNPKFDSFLSSDCPRSDNPSLVCCCIQKTLNSVIQVQVKMVAEWDSNLKEHLRRKQNHEIQFDYLSHKIQNELILLIAAEIKGAVLKRIKEAKYFSVILDCTPDISKQEQMTLIIRRVDVSTVPIQVQEYFLQFLVVNDTTGQGLFEELKNVLHHLGLDIDDVRGQGHDNGSNMKGKHKGALLGGYI